MTVQVLTDLDVGFGWDSNETSFADLKSVIQELQGIHLSVVSGAVNAATSMTISGLATTDTILSAWQIPTDTPLATTLIDRTAATTIYAADTIRCADAMTTSSMLVVLWFDKSGR